MNGEKHIDGNEFDFLIGKSVKAIVRAEDGYYIKLSDGTTLKLESNEGCDNLFTTLFYPQGIDEVCINEEILNKEVIATNGSILTKEEKEYLRAVIKPFRNNVEYISKRRAGAGFEYEYILICSKNEEDDLCFPNFPSHTMYKGMQIYQEYSLNELGL